MAAISYYDTVIACHVSSHSSRKSTWENSHNMHAIFDRLIMVFSVLG